MCVCSGTNKHIEHTRTHAEHSHHSVAPPQCTKTFHRHEWACDSGWLSLCGGWEWGGRHGVLSHIVELASLRPYATKHHPLGQATRLCRRPPFVVFPLPRCSHCQNNILYQFSVAFITNGIKFAYTSFGPQTRQAWLSNIHSHTYVHSCVCECVYMCSYESRYDVYSLYYI